MRRFISLILVTILLFICSGCVLYEREGHEGREHGEYHHGEYHDRDHGDYHDRDYDERGARY